MSLKMAFRDALCPAAGRSAKIMCAACHLDACDVSRPVPGRPDAWRTAVTGRDSAVVALCQDTSAAGLVLDFDGVLSPIVADPTTSRMANGVGDSLRTVARHLNLVAVMSGRPLDFLIDRATVPGVRLLGSYGVEAMHDGQRTRHPGVTPWLEPVRRATVELQAAVADLAGVRVEEKSGLSVAVHWRQAADQSVAERRIPVAVAQVAQSTGLRRESGKLVEELRPPLAIDKGTTLAELVRGRNLRVVVYVGDDLGDLPAFRVVHEVGGYALLVDHGSETDARLRELATDTLDGVEELARWLSRLGYALET
jgi:trehalose 6-phosphate phosphatase